MAIAEQPATTAPRTNSPGIAVPARAVVVTPELVKLRDLVTTGAAYACLPLRLKPLFRESDSVAMLRSSKIGAVDADMSSSHLRGSLGGFRGSRD
jgi:hypothetical protein